jgi:acetylornithine/N-succinyldiaminopimelate aminotransferase
MKHIIWSTGHKLKFDNIIDSDNCYIFDTQGRKLIDLESGVWCTCLGHNNKRLNKLITDQINKITHTGFCYCHPQIEATAIKLLEINNFHGGKCEFMCSGSEAVEYGMRVARTLSDRPLALAFSDSYFGSYGDAATKADQMWFIYDRLNCSCNQKNTGCTGECEEFNQIPFEKIGIFALEPGSSSGLVRFPDPQLIEKIATRIHENDGILLSNEITTGIGRTGKWFGYQHYNIQPDIVAMGKGLGNGYPISATAISKQLAEKLSQHAFHYSQSHQNDPLGAIVAGEVIDIIKENNLIDAAEFNGNYLKENLQRLKQDFSVIKDIRGRGLMLAIEFSSQADWIFEELLNKGFIVAKRSNAEVLRIDPALTIEKETMDLFLLAFHDILSKLAKDNF